MGCDSEEDDPAPSVSTVVPNTGSMNGGTVVAITGSDFVDGATVAFGGVAATTVIFVGSTAITATTPAHAAGEVDVSVENPDGGRGTLGGAFTYEQ